MLVPFDTKFFEKRGRIAAESNGTLEDRFRLAFATNLWGADESRSGGGSTLQQTDYIADILPSVLDRFGVRRLLDLPCGDFNWMRGVDLSDVEYIGGDILPELIERNTAMTSGDRRFEVLDLCGSPLPDADLLFCRDCLVHLSFADIARALENIRRADIAYLMTTTFPDEPENVDIVSGDWRPINLELPPFSFPKPEALITERCTEQTGLFADKSLGIWQVNRLAG